MLADRVDGSGLRPFCSGFLLEPNLRADFEPVKSAVRDRMAMEIDFTAVPRFDEAAILAGQKARHFPLRRRGVLLHLAAQVAHGVLDLADRGVEGVFYGDGGVLMFGRVAMGSVHDHILVARHRDAQGDLEVIALLTPRALADGQAAGGDPLAEFFEPRELPLDFGAKGVRGFEMMKGDFRRRLHDLAP